MTNDWELSNPLRCECGHAAHDGQCQVEIGTEQNMPETFCPCDTFVPAPRSVIEGQCSQCNADRRVLLAEHPAAPQLGTVAWCFDCWQTVRVG